MNRVKSLTEHLWFEVPARRRMINITPTVAALVHRSAVQEGLCLVNAMHHGHRTPSRQRPDR
jgi:thiamine phosphate synthase YjbQ (UPF0047 family)